MSRLLCILLAACLLVVVRAGHEAEAESSGSGDGAQHRESLFDLVNGQSIVECDQCLTDRYLHHEDGMSSYGCETLRRTRPHGDIGVEGGHGELDYQSQGGPRKQPSAEKATDMAAEKKKFCSRLGKLAPKSALMAKQRPAAVLLKHWGIKMDYLARHIPLQGDEKTDCLKRAHCCCVRSASGSSCCIFEELYAMQQLLDELI